jgi:hypothetical protein
LHRNGWLFFTLSTAEALTGRGAAVGGNATLKRPGSLRSEPTNRNLQTKSTAPDLLAISTRVHNELHARDGLKV